MATDQKDRVYEVKAYRQYLMDKLRVETSSVETFEPEKNEDAYIRKLEDKIERLKSMIDEMDEKSKELAFDMRDGFDKERNTLLKKYSAAKSILNDIQKFTGDAYKELNAGAVKAYQDLANSVENAISNITQALLFQKQ
ncbi:MAG: hypothetical protein R6X10_10930 [Desulfobacterales bacterium]